MKILVDTCGWIEWLTDGQLRKQYEPYFNKLNSMIAPTSVQFELYKWVARKKGIQQALETIALTEQAEIIPLSTSIALSAADFSAEHKLSFAYAIIYASAQFHKASLITSDDHFKGLSDVIFIEKKIRRSFIAVALLVPVLMHPGGTEPWVFTL